MKIERHIVIDKPKEQNMSVLKNQTSIIEKMRYQGKKSNEEVNCCILMDIQLARVDNKRYDWFCRNQMALVIVCKF
jgi:hypothetical protein